MPSDHLPFAVATNVDFCESPIVTRVSTLRLTNSLQPTGDDGGVRIHANTKIGCFITLKLNSSRSHDREGFRLIQDLHVSHSYNQIIRTQTVYGVGVTTQICLVPNFFEL